MYCSIDHARVISLSGGAFSEFYPIADRILARLSINLIVGKTKQKSTEFSVYKAQNAEKRLKIPTTRPTPTKTATVRPTTTKVTALQS